LANARAGRRRNTWLTKVGALLELLESGHSESTRLEYDLKRTSRLLQLEAERSNNLNRQVTRLAKIADSPNRSAERSRI